jgi:hypothetical protein
MESLYKGQSIVLELNIIPRAFNNGHYAVFSIKRSTLNPLPFECVLRERTANHRKRTLFTLIF